MDMGIIARILGQGGGPAYVNPLIDRGFANSGASHNRMLGRYGGTTPPNPTPRPQTMPQAQPQGILGRVMQQQGAPASPTPPQPTQPQPGGQGILGRMRGFMGDNRMALMGMGAGILNNGLAGGPSGAFQGSQLDYARGQDEQARADEQSQRARREQAVISLMTQQGLSREQAQTYVDAGMGGAYLESTMGGGGAEQYRPITPQERQAFGLDETTPYMVGPSGQPELVELPDTGASGGSIPAELAGRLAAVDTVLPQLDQAERILTDEDFSVGERIGAAVGSVTPFETEFNSAQRTVRVAIEAALRMMTGAAAPESEVRQYMDMFMPQMQDRLPARQQKMQNLRAFLMQARQYVLQGRADIPLPESTSAPASQGGDIGTQAQDAIRRGADPAAVARRLREAGYDPAQYGIGAPTPAGALPPDYFQRGGA